MLSQEPSSSRAALPTLFRGQQARFRSAPVSGLSKGGGLLEKAGNHPPQGTWGKDEGRNIENGARTREGGNWKKCERDMTKREPLVDEVGKEVLSQWQEVSHNT